MASLVFTMALAPVLAQQQKASAATPTSTPAPAPAPVATGDPAKGKALFESASCGACHALAAAGASGEVGPALDHNDHLTHALIVSRVASGQGAMPSFGEQFTQAQVDDIAAYVLSAAAK
ncbi:c-type cytochrome [Sphingobium nicotianae]|uniref:C-type cytochrome n=1 Tax=Sphingobium nicotianae TaxID=2782607 RepID=A0A9X1IRV8_9SPHN|nr:cytochrome c [Sphingobium nicotianae]MBT2187813.1 c-type cytochrome [Sphingobium nicotianae]